MVSGGLWTLGCTDEIPSVSPFPVRVDVTVGPILVGLQAGDESAIIGSIDTMSPVTIIDSFRPGQELGSPRRRILDIGLLSRDPGSSTEPVTQARFGGVDTLDLHPCGDTEGATDAEVGECLVGDESSNQVIRGILGADVLSRYAVRFDVGSGCMSFFPDIAGNDRDRATMCEAVFPSPFFGAGTLVVGGAERPYSGRRIALGACFRNARREAELQALAIEPTIEHLPGIAQGLDGMFLLSTGLGITIVSESSYQQYKRQELELIGVELPDGPAVRTLHLPSGPVTYREGRMSHLSLVSEASDQRGPCYERYANAFFAAVPRCDSQSDPKCPCGGGSQVCNAGAVVEIEGEFPVAVVSDDEVLLQGLRDELRPTLPEIDGILGTDILASLVVDVDYPNGRVIIRCSPGAENCRTRPALRTIMGEDPAADCPAPATCAATAAINSGTRPR